MMKRTLDEYKNSLFGEQPLTLGLRQDKPEFPPPEAESQALVKWLLRLPTGWQGSYGDAALLACVWTLPLGPREASWGGAIAQNLLESHWRKW